ncbi:ArsR/SmtB family transcription factor [Halomarina rubra]|uniref:ArsR/SmtB family transcription factor n=1 Tax=Halomarina rubra TaxID=2071873 RepID=A0ABD6AW97_9EURY|nr:metalloregulator ArsR/SmtB family transcription factor [Halomarina rubra]
MSQQTTAGEETGETGEVEEADAACCSTGVAIDEASVAADVRLLSALGNDTRYEALRLVAEAGDDGVCVCEVQPALGVSQGAVSQALSRLHGAGLVDRRKEGRWRYYSATPVATRLLDTLDEVRGATDE